jgi:hypothetical protein
LTISSTIRKAGPFTGNGVTTAFPFTFKVFTSADLLVVQAVTSTGVEATKTLTTDYTVALNADQNASPGGTVTMLVAPPTGTTLVLTSQVGNLQPTDLTNAGGFYPSVINSSLDRATIQIQQLAEKISRTLSLSITSVASAVLPSPVALALIGWNAAGTALQNYAGALTVGVSSFMATVVNAVDAAAARVLLVAAQSGANTDITSLSAHPVGKMLAQVQTFQTGTVATGAGTIPQDDTIPQNTEGDQYMSLSITPQNALSTLEIDVQFFGSTGTGGGNPIIVALFQDSTANALAAADQYQLTPNAITSVSLKHTMTAGTTSATTFKVRAGGTGAGTTTFNGFSAGRTFGGVIASRITIKEYLP